MFPSEEQDRPKNVAEPPGRWLAGLSAGMPLFDALEVTFRQRYEAVLYYLPLAAHHADENIEFVHKLRVACRRLAAALNVLAKGFPDAAHQPLLTLVAEARRDCGRARDLDVRRMFLETLLPLASVEEAAVIELLCEKIVCRREREQKRVRRHLDGLEIRVREAGAKLMSSLGQIVRDASTRNGTFGETGRHLLAKELDNLWNLAAEDLELPGTLHKLRIAGKHLRYTFEIFIPVLDVSFREDFYPQLEAMQDLLGEIHDANEATRAFQRIKKKWKGWRGTKKWARCGLAGFRWRRLRAGLEAVVLAYTQQAGHSRTQFLDLWPGFSGDSFRQPIAELIALPLDPISSKVTHDLPNGEPERK